MKISFPLDSHSLASRGFIRCRIVEILPFQRDGGPYFPGSIYKRNLHVSYYYLNGKLHRVLPHTFFLTKLRGGQNSRLEAAKARVLIRLTHAGPDSRLRSFKSVAAIIQISTPYLSLDLWACCSCKTLGTAYIAYINLGQSLSVPSDPVVLSGHSRANNYILSDCWTEKHMLASLVVFSTSIESAQRRLPNQSPG